MNNLSINIVHTHNYGKELLDNKKLIEQLIQLIKLGCKVNILVNGESPITDELIPGADLIFRSNRVTLGRARFLLARMTETDWYIQADEDDCFVGVDWYEKLNGCLSRVTTPTAFFKFKIIEDGKEEIRPGYPGAALLRSKKLNLIKPYEHCLISCGMAYSKKILGEFPRPFINFAEDDLTWLYLCKHAPYTTYIPVLVYEYNKGASVMSKEVEEDKISEQHGKGFDHLLGYVGLKLMEVIE